MGSGPSFSIASHGHGLMGPKPMASDDQTRLSPDDKIAQLYSTRQIKVPVCVL